MKLYNIYTHKHNKNKIMNITEVRSIIRQVIAEAMEDKKNGLPKSGGKLVHLKKELQSLKGMREALGQYQIAEGGEETPGFVAEYAHMQKFVNELEKIKAAHSKLAEMLDNQISEVEGKVSSETEKVKEMMGLIEKAKKPAVKKDDKKAAKKDDKKEDKKEEPKEEKPAAKKAEKKDK
jgi:flagellar biosynthesis chaperone FliJ